MYSDVDLASAFPTLVGLSVIKRSGQRDVYRASMSGASVVLKVFKPSVHVDQRTQREIEAVATLNSGLVPRILDNGQRKIANDAYRFVIEEFIEGKSLKEILVSSPQPGLPKTFYFLESLLRFACDCENAGLVHRDIKPDNIMIADDGKLWVIDFGIVRILGRESVTPTSWAQGIFTPGYGAPEQIKNQKSEIDIRTDLYSIGVVVYELLNGVNPFYVGKRNVLEVVQHQENADLPRLSIPEDTTGILSDLIASLTARYPSRRPRSAAEALAWAADARTQLASFL